jgi:small subunit ribosomal protein S8
VLKKPAGKDLPVYFKNEITNKKIRQIMVTYPIADYLTRIRNAVMANHRIVEIPTSKMKKEMTKILFEKGYILNYKFEDETKPGIIKIALKYHPVSKISAINSLVRISKPGLRKYVDADHLPRVLNGLGIAIISTSQGVMTDKEAKTKKIGGEVLCFIS